MTIQDVEFLNDFYITAIGSTLATNPTTNPFGFTASASLDTYITTPSSNQGSITTSKPHRHGLPQGAIDGIAAGAAVVGVLIIGLIAFFCIRARQRKRTAGAADPPIYISPPMQEPGQSPPPKAFGDYQSIPQPDQQNTQYPGPHQQAQSYFPPSASAVSPQSSTGNDPRFSTANASFLSSSQQQPSEPDRRKNESYNAPLSPLTTTEVDGTTGNPGAVPSEATTIAHGAPPTEVDGTMGNPGIPIGGHGIEYQLMPGGSPSAAEMEGRMSGGGVSRSPVSPRRYREQQGYMGASMDRPFSDGPYELGQQGR